MKTLELMRGLSYFTPGMSCKAEKGKPFVVEEDGLADALMATGKFRELDAADVLSGEAEPLNDGQNNAGSASGGKEGEADTGNGEGEELTEEKVDAMKMPELIALAGEHGIDISECKNNDERKAIIKDILFSSDMFNTEE
jgi:hypothetical protein